jgi:hypothetical protein
MHVLVFIYILQVLQEAEDAGVFLETPAWNALLMCAGEGTWHQRRAAAGAAEL